MWTDETYKWLVLLPKVAQLRMVLFPVWIYFPTLGGEGTFVRVGVKTEFIALWLPSRMTRYGEGLPSQRGRLLWQGKRKELPLKMHAGRARSELKFHQKLQKLMCASGFICKHTHPFGAVKGKFWDKHTGKN